MLKHMLLQAAGADTVYGPNFEHWGEADKLLKLADKTPNTAGLKLLDIQTDVAELEQALKQQAVKLVISLDNDAEKLRVWLRESGVQVIYLATHQTPLAQDATVALPLT